MKNTILFLIFFATNITIAQTPKHTLTVQIAGFKNNQGKAIVGLYNKQQTFLKTVYKGLFADIKANMVTVVFSDIPIGEYAVSLFHDQNNDGKLNKNYIGIPTEDYAASNNAKGFMGPPKYQDAKFKITKNTTINIQVNN